MQIGQTIKQLRKLKKIKQNIFCKTVGISQTALSQIEGDIKYPSPTTLKGIAKAFDIPEVLIYMLSIKRIEVPKNKRVLYDHLFPSIQNMIYCIVEK